MAQTKRNEGDILAELIAAKEAYGALAANKVVSVGELEAAGATVRTLSNELSAYLVDGAKPCGGCGASGSVIGMLKTPPRTINGMDYPAVWEVGCISCPPYLVEREDGSKLLIDGKASAVKRRSWSARGFSRDETVAKWNDGRHVEDSMFERIPGFVAVYSDE
jgi:hypothetical protein